MKPSKLLLVQVDSDGKTFYHCKYCEYRSKNHTNAKVHQRIHSNERPHVCDFCSYASNSASNLKKHLLQHSNVAFTCAHCSYSTKSKQYLKKHMRSHSEETNVTDIFWCSLCHLYELPQGVEEHLRSSKHKLMVSKFPHRCSSCEAGFFEPVSLAIHTEVEHSTDKHHCNRCSYSSTSGVLLKAHMRNVHEGAQDFQCGWCGERFLLEESQREHVLQNLLLQTIERRARLSCAFCRKTFQHKDVVRKHEVEEHSFITTGRIRCCVCRKTFRTKKSHRAHICQKRRTEQPVLHCVSKTSQDSFHSTF
ncbi:zinc finger protein 16-like [Galendromus occidentalis]|uniref:Zinc finger protein 16-like n=1 Tax=Galendromus occidentalis TaxID=34638 RepID=A0AAJ7SJM9_9ACAR|nr:zinc finger protein 16-like [Galendromus occidentalis]